MNATPDDPLFVDQTLFESDVVSLGLFRCSPDYPTFSDTGPTGKYCLVFPRTAVRIQHEGGEPFVADLNTVPVYNAGHPYRRAALSAAGDRSDWFALAPDLLREILRDLDGPASAAGSPFRFGWSYVNAQHYLAQRRIFRYVATARVVDGFRVEEQVVNLAAEVLAAAYASPQSGTSPGAAPVRQRTLVERARERLTYDTRAPLSLSALARELDTSVFHLCRLFKRQTGYTLHQYRTELRLKESLEWLEQKPKDILDIAVSFGFSGHSHYTRSFHKTFGLPPSRADL